MQKSDTLIRTKLHRPYTRSGLVPRPRLQEQVAQGLRSPLILITAPAGFGKTTLVSSCIDRCGMPVAWLSLDKDDNQPGRFLTYLVSALQEVDRTVGSEAAQLLAMSPPASPEAILTCLINDLDATGRQILLVLDDYQFISSQAVHESLAFLLEHCPMTFHLAIATRSDPPLPLTRLRARGQTVELRAADLSFTEPEAAHFLNDVMDLGLDAGSVAALQERTEGWIAGLQMASIALQARLATQSHLSLRDRKDVNGFIESFSGTNRYILDYLLEEVLASQPPEIQHFLLHTSILERLSAPLCEAVIETLERPNVSTFKRANEILDYLDRSNLFLVPLDGERIWYRYHHLFSDLLRARLDQLYPGVSQRLHARAADWYEQNGSILEAIQHASMASDDGMVERLIEQNYLELMNSGEMSWVRFWMDKLSKELVFRRPWLCLYESMNRSWFGQLEEANRLLAEAEKCIRAQTPAEIGEPGVRSMLGYHHYVKSRVTAMQGDTRRAIELCNKARQTIPADNLGLQIDVSITLGYEYFLYGDFQNAEKVLNEMIRLGYNARAINNPVAGYAVLSRMRVYQGRLHEAYDLLQKAERLTQEGSGQYLGVNGLVEVGTAALLYEWNEVEVALARLKRGLEYLPLWGKVDDFCLAYATLARIQLARGCQTEAESAIEKAVQLVQTRGVFSEARGAVETSQVKIWLLQGNWSSVDRWSAAQEERFGSEDRSGFDDELTQITLARVFIAQSKSKEAIHLLSDLEEVARSAGRTGRVIEILLLKAMALWEIGDPEQALQTLTNCLSLAHPEGYVRVFLDESRAMQRLLVHWLAHASQGSLRDYAARLLSQFDTGRQAVKSKQAEFFPAGGPMAGSGQSLVEPLSPREMEVLHLISLGRTNQEVARQLIVSPGTVKAHTASIYRKLDVANRTEAVARARLLGILP